MFYVLAMELIFHRYRIFICRRDGHLSQLSLATLVTSLATLYLLDYQCDMFLVTKVALDE